MWTLILTDEQAQFLYRVLRNLQEMAGSQADTPGDDAGLTEELLAMLEPGGA